jgi:hypothetical protein
LSIYKYFWDFFYFVSFIFFLFFFYYTLLQATRMTRSKDSIYASRHEKHVARNGQSESRYGLKKLGAGVANWGVLGDEVADVQGVARAEIETNPNTGTKLKLVDHETFENMRIEQQS